MKDHLVRVIARNSNIMGIACLTTHLADETCKLHGTGPTASVALGRALTGGALMGALLKKGQGVALKFEGNGPLKKIIVEADSLGAVRGYVAVPNVSLPLSDGKQDVAAALGRAGLLTVIKDLGLKEPYRGVVQLHTSEIGEDIAFYLTESEQIPSAVGLGVFVEPDGSVSAAGGFLVQSFPPHDKKTVDAVIRHIEDIPPLTGLVRKGMNPEALIERLFEGTEWDRLETRELVLQCSCSRERVKRALEMIGEQEIIRMIEEEEKTDVTCEFCRRAYMFERRDLERLVKAIRAKNGEKPGRQA